MVTVSARRHMFLLLELQKKIGCNFISIKRLFTHVRRAYHAENLQITTIFNNKVFRKWLTYAQTAVWNGFNKAVVS